VLGYTEYQLMRITGIFYPTAINWPFQGNGIIYISNEAMADRLPEFPYRSYAHELANILDYRIFGFSSVMERHFGFRYQPPFDDYDTGMAVEWTLFGPRDH